MQDLVQEFLDLERKFRSGESVPDWKDQSESEFLDPSLRMVRTVGLDGPDADEPLEPFEPIEAMFTA